jgi:hypothetical protein
MIVAGVLVAAIVFCVALDIVMHTTFTILKIA